MTSPNGYPTPESQPAFRDPLDYDYTTASRDPVYAAEWRGALEYAVDRDLAAAFDTYQTSVVTGMADEGTTVEQLTLKSPDVGAANVSGDLSLARHTKLETREQVTTISWIPKTEKKYPSGGIHWIYTSTPRGPGRLLPARKDPATGEYVPKTRPQDPGKYDATLDQEVAFGAQTLPDGIRRARPGFSLRRKR